MSNMDAFDGDIFEFEKVIIHADEDFQNDKGIRTPVQNKNKKNDLMA